MWIYYNKLNQFKKMKQKLNKILRRFGAEIHGVGYIAKLKAESSSRNANQKIAELTKGDQVTIFDIGANRGSTTMEMLEIFPKAKIHAFEPFQDSADIFRKNHLDKANVTLVQKGMADRMGTATLNVNKSVDTNSLLASKKLGATSDKSCETLNQVEINLETVDNYCKANAIERIHVLKIDVQGAEIKVLKGAEQMLRSGKVDLIYLETYFVQQYEEQPLFHEIATLLHQYGFTLQDIYDAYYNDRHILWSDSIFIYKTQ